MKWKQRHFYCEPNEDSGKRKPRQFACEQAVFAQASKSSKIKSAFCEINSEKREQHRHAAEKCIKEELGRGAIAVFASPDLDEQKCRNQAHFVKQKPENKILRGERAVER